MLAYEGARTDRRTSGWLTIDSAANSEIGPAITFLRKRSRDLVRNNAYAARALNELVGHAVGTGITAQARITGITAQDSPSEQDQKRAKALAAEIDRAWKVWVQECDADGQLDLYGLQRLAARSIVEGGEVIIRLRPRYSSDGFHVPFQIQVLEPDYLDLNKTQSTPTGYIIQGVEFDKLGQRVAYWLFPQHPGEVLIPWVTSSTLRSQRVDAKYVLHIYRKDRAGQVRGVPWFAPVIISLRDLDEYCEAELVRKKIEACFGLIVTQPDASEGPSLGTVHTEDHQIVETMEPGMIKYTRPGEEVTSITPSGTGSGYRDYMRDVQTRIASGIDLTYEQLTGDLSNVNYSSYRAGLLSFRNNIDALRWLTFIPMFCTPVRNWFIDLAVAAERISRPEYGTEWTPPSYGSVDPVKDADATLAKIRMGTQTWEQAVGEEGYDPDEQLAAIARRNKAWDDAGVILDCDPRHRSAKGGSVSAGDKEEPAVSKQTFRRGKS
jgi:lambda family phage portal protein